jgi:SNF2 family DNA or RNA helicase
MVGLGELPDGDLADEVWFVGPKSALESVYLDMYKWAVPDFLRSCRMMTYERLTIDGPDLPTPKVVIFDECTQLKNPTSHRAKAAQKITDEVRRVHKMDGMVICMSGSPTAKRPDDIWSQAEVVWPGYLREGSLRAFQSRYAIVEEMQNADGVWFPKLVGWKEKEVAKLPRRLEGLMSVYRKSEILNLPPRTKEVRRAEPTARIKRVAKAIVEASESTMTALTSLRTLSSGFQYKEGSAGPDGARAMVETVCPKDDMLREILAEDESRGRIITFASFQGSIDRVRRICEGEGWDVITIDGRGWNSFRGGERVKDHVLDFWRDNPTKTAVVGNPASCRYGLTLTEAKTTVYYDQNFSAEHRLQSMDRNYRIGQDEPVRVIDLVHLPVDDLIRETLEENRKLEELSLGLIYETLS